MNKKISILITSCDKFYDTWDKVAYSFEKHWPNCQYEIYLMSNNIDFKHPKIKNIKIGDDMSWSLNLKSAINQIKTEYVFLWLDDVFLTSGINIKDLNNIEEFIISNNINFLRLRPDPKPDKWGNNFFGEIKQNSLFYRVSIFATIWKRSILEKLLLDHETAWDFELKGSIRSKIYNGFYCIKRQPFSYIHGIEKGLWKRDAIIWLKSIGFEIDLKYRNQMTVKESNMYNKSKLKYQVLNFLPSRYRHLFMYYFQKFSVTLNLRKKVTFTK